MVCLFSSILGINIILHVTSLYEAVYLNVITSNIIYVIEEDCRYATSWNVIA